MKAKKIKNTDMAKLSHIKHMLKNEQETINENLQILRAERENRLEDLNVNACHDAAALNPFYFLLLINQKIKKMSDQELKRRFVEEFKGKIEADNLLNAVADRVEIIQKASEHELDDFLAENNVLDILSNEKINQMLNTSFGIFAQSEQKHTHEETYNESDSHTY